MMENIPNLRREKVTQIQETQRVPSKRNPKALLQDTSKLKWQNSKIKTILKAAREKQKVTCKGAPIRLAADFSMEMLQARRFWQDIFQVMKNKGLQ